MKKKIIFCTIAVLVIVALVFYSLAYDHRNNGNYATTISGLWSAVATLAVGLIAYWQSKKYQNNSDDTIDAMLMPDLYQSTAFSDEYQAPFEQYRAFVQGRLDFTEAEGYKVSQPIHLSFVKGPILNLTVKEIRNKTEGVAFVPENTISLRDEAIPFNLVIQVPEKWLKDRAELSVILNYENIYGAKFEKTIRLSFNPDMTVDSISFEKAKRILHIDPYKGMKACG